MPAMTIDDLVRFLTESAGYEEALGTTADVTDAAFEDLGYDSLALLETAARIEQEFGITVPDGEMTELRTPRAVIDLVNSLLAEPA
jgi:act minimal PKS acyl carrier protein